MKQELCGEDLDQAVASIIGGAPVKDFQPSRKWSHGGPIIDAYLIHIAAVWAYAPERGDYPTGEWQAFRKIRKEGDPFIVCRGPTALVAAMRCLVATGWDHTAYGNLTEVKNEETS